MQRVEANFLLGLRFSQRDSEFERLLNLTTSAKRGVLTTRRKHELKFTILGGIPYTLIQSVNGGIYTLSNDGALRFGTSVLDTGYSTSSGKFHIGQISQTVAQQYLFVAANRMKKVNLSNNAVTNWGIQQPFAVLGPINVLPNELVINGCDSLTGWTTGGTGVSVSVDSSISTDGLGSIKIDASASSNGFATFTFGSALNVAGVNLEDFIYLSIRMTKPDEIEELSVILDFGDGSFNVSTFAFSMGMEGTARGAPLEAQYTGASDAWKECHLKLLHFQPHPMTSSLLKAIRFRVRSAGAVSIYVDRIRFLLTGPDASDGSRWAYRYKNTVTGVVSNLCTPTFGPPFRSFRYKVVLTGFIPSTDPQVDLQEVFRDTNGNGVFQFVGSKPNDSNIFIDETPTFELGEVASSDNLPPVAASIVAFHSQRVWINDLTAPGRIWRSKPQRPETFSEFFTLGTPDVITFMGTIGGQFTIMTLNEIIRVLGAETDTPTFTAVADIGGLTPVAATLRGDTADIIHLSGMYNFNGSNLVPFPHINTLFEQNSTDVRRLNKLNIDTAALGSSDTDTWLTYSRLNGNPITFVYNSASGEWYEESVHLIAHDTAHLTVDHVASDGVGNVWSLYNDHLNYETGLHIPQLTDLTHKSVGTIVGDANIGISRIKGFGLEYYSTVTNSIQLFVDEVEQRVVYPGASLGPGTVDTLPVELPPTPSRQWFHVSLEAVGKRLGWVLTLNGFTEIYSAEWWILQMVGDSTSFDTGDMLLSDALVTPVQIFVHFYAHKPLSWSGVLNIDGQINSGVFYVPTAGPVYQRFTLRPTVGRTARFTINATEEFSPIAFTLGVIGFGDGALRSVALYPKAS